jgi:hypothetical protein
MTALTEAATTLHAILRQEAEAARQAALPALTALMQDKQAALEALARAGLPATEAERTALRGMMLAAEENALVLGAVAGALETVRDQLRLDLSQAADPGLYAPGTGRQRRPLRHTLAASLDRTA